MTDTAAPPSAPTRPRFAYIPGLDGMRGFWVVVGPIIYHARPDFLPGGILAIDLFFVLSRWVGKRLGENEYLWERGLQARPRKKRASASKKSPEA